MSTRSVQIRRRKALVGATALISISVLSLPAPSLAQSVSVGTEQSVDERSSTVLQPIVVRDEAGNKDENAADVAGKQAAISLDARQVESRRLLSFEDVLRSTPGVSVNSSGGTNVSTIYVRGVGSLYPMSLDDSPVGVAIDGNPVSARNMSLATLDVDNIDILKGPQSTRYAGLNAAGLVDVTTRQPTRETEGYIRAEYGQERQRLLEGAIGGPISEDLSGRFALRYSGSDHWVTNLQNGEPLTEPHDLAYRGSLLWDIDDRTSALFSLEKREMKGLPNLLVLRPYGDEPGLDITPGTYDDVKKSVDRYAVRVQHDFNTTRLTSRTAFTKSASTDVAAYDGNLNQAMYGYPSEYWIVDEARERVFNQSVELSSLPDDPISWLLGAAVERGDRSYDTPRNAYGSAEPKYRQFDTTRYGIFGEITYPVQEDLKLTAGLRQSWQRTSYDGEYHSGGSISSDSRGLSESFTTGRLGITYSITPQTDLHATLSRGYTPGGFNIYATQPADSEPYRGATTDMFEIGFRSELDGGRFAVSGSAYVNRVKDNHLLSYDSMTYVVSALNADTRSMGAELQGTWRSDHGLEVTAGLSYVDAEIRSNVYGVGDGDVLAGNNVPDVSPWSASLAVSHRQELSGFLGLSEPVLTTGLSYRYVGERPADPQNHFDLKAYHKLDLRVGLSQGATEFYVRADNVLDQKYDLYGYYAPASDVSYGGMARGRTFLAGLTHRF